MSLIPPIYLVDPSNQQWLVTCSNQAVLIAVPVTGQPYAPPDVYLNSVTDNSSWRVCVVGNPPPVGWNWGDIQPVSIPQGNYPTQILITAPNGTVYGIQIANLAPPVIGQPASGILQTALPVDTSSLTCNTPISTLAANALERLEENYLSGIDSGPVFWNEQFEIYSAIVEAENDLLLLVGRPTQTVSMPFMLTPNTVWQRMPKGLFAISDVQGPQSAIRKYSLFSYDYEQPGNLGSDWENDTGTPTSWAPIGMGMFIVHPAPVAPMSVLLTGIAYPVAETNFPYTGAELVPFHHEFHVALEEYAAHVCRIKEGGSELQESMTLYQSYLTLAKRMTEIESRKDDLIFSKAFGAPAGVNPHTRR